MKPHFTESPNVWLRASRTYQSPAEYASAVERFPEKGHAWRFFAIAIACALAALFLAGCKPNERQEIREAEARAKREADRVRAKYVDVGGNVWRIGPDEFGVVCYGSGMSVDSCVLLTGDKQ